MSKAGIRLPIESHVLQAFVSEGLKPVLDNVITFGAGHFYVSQSDKGGLVFGGDIDGYNSYAQRGNLPVVEDVCEGGMAIMPMIGRARLLRMWGALWICQWMVHRLLIKLISMVYILMVAGVMVVLKQLQRVDIAMLIF